VERIPVKLKEFFINLNHLMAFLFGRVPWWSNVGKEGKIQLPGMRDNRKANKIPQETTQKMTLRPKYCCT